MAPRDSPVPLAAVAFDLDGTIVNSEDLYQHAGDAVLRRRGKLHDPALRAQMMGRPVVDAVQIMIDYHQLPDPLDDLMRECREALEELMATSLAAMPGVNELLDELDKKGTSYAVATSGTRDYADYVLTRLDIRERFQFVLTAEDVARGKPNPEIYLLAARRFGIEPHAMMVLEDSANGCRAGVAAGAFTVAIPNDHTGDHDFTGARFVAHSLLDPRILAAL
jgi:HAD superfamily hydrolase (TIGR01509 family)